MYELVEDRGVKTEEDSCEYRDKVLLVEDMVAKDTRLSFSDILSGIAVYLLSANQSRSFHFGVESNLAFKLVAS